jgi:hypothetical protein
MSLLICCGPTALSRDETWLRLDRRASRDHIACAEVAGSVEAGDPVARSWARSHRFRSIGVPDGSRDPAKPMRRPVLPITRWQGTMMGRGLRRMA